MKSIRLHTWGDPQHPPLLLVHGLTEAGTAWPDAVQRWDTAWHIQAVDLRGHGHSPRFDAATTPLMFGTMVDDIIEVLKTIGPATVIGHSLGGRVAAVAATVRPDLVRALVLEDPALTEGTANPARLHRRATLLPRPVRRRRRSRRTPPGEARDELDRR